MKWLSSNEFLKQTINKCYDMDGYPKNQKYQCWDYGDYFWVNQCGRALITKAGGNGCARDCWNISRNVNAGNDFDLIYDRYALRVGDWVIFGGGNYGHIGIVKSVVKAGSLIELQGENQGSIQVNIIRRSLNDFLGAFRYKGWHNSIPKKSNDEIAREVIAGKWGNGEDRKNRLKNAGYDYNTIQGIVNNMLNNKPSGKKSNDEIAREVIAGKWGNGQIRKNKLIAAGYDYNIIQGIVNKLLKK